MSRINNQSKVKAFIKAAGEIKQHSNKPPKFKIGDYVINSRFKVISKIVDIINIFENEDMSINYEVAQYVLKDIKNESRDKFMAGFAQVGIDNSVQREYKRYKPVHAIDAYYQLMSPAVAQALYGNKVTEEK